jgi:glycogen synthase
LDKDIKIAFITPEAPPFSGGGIATFIHNITKGLNEAGIYCEVFAPALDGITKIETLNNVLFHRIKIESTFSDDVASYFLRLQDEKKFTIIESCEIHASLKTLLESKIENVKFITRVQMPVVYQTWLNNFYEAKILKLRYVIGALRRGRLDYGFWNKADKNKERNEEYLVCSKSDYIIAPSNSFKNWLVNFWKIPSQKIEVVFHLFDFFSFKVSSEKLVSKNKKHEKISILFVGKLNAHKGVINLAKAAKKILQKYQNVEFVLIGDDWNMPYKFKIDKASNILREIVKSNINFRLLGKVNYNELPYYLNEADICIYPSLWEAWGYTCTEAMSFGKAVVGSKFGGMADAIEHDENGLLINPFKVSEIENALVKLIEDESLRIRLGKKAAETVYTKLNFHNLVKQNIDLYKKVLSNE